MYVYDIIAGRNNALLFTYGISNSGKTFTIQGERVYTCVYAPLCASVCACECACMYTYIISNSGKPHLNPTFQGIMNNQESCLARFTSSSRASRANKSRSYKHRPLYLISSSAHFILFEAPPTSPYLKLLPLYLVLNLSHYTLS